MANDNDRRDPDDEIRAQWARLLIEPVNPPPRLRARILSEVQGAQRYAPFSDTIQRVFDLSETDVQNLFARAATASSWTQGIAPVRRYLDFRPGRQAGAPRAGLVALAAHCRIPAHRHDAPEVMLVLEGSITDDRGYDAEAGACIESAVGSSHAVIVGPEGAVVALLHGKTFLLGH